MDKCLHGGPKFLVKMIPVSKMTSAFLYDQVTSIINLITNSSSDVVCVIADNNSTNQAFFKHFYTVDKKPWKAKEELYLLFDYVHLIKSIRNNWITEKSQELEFEFKKFTEFGRSLKSLVDLYQLSSFLL